MKKYILSYVFPALLFVSMLFSAPSSSYARDFWDNDAWFMAGYGWSFHSDNPRSVNGPVKVSAGGNVWKFLAIEASFDTSWSYYGRYYPTWYGRWVSVDDNLWTFDLKPFLLVQPSFGNNVFALKPYVGIAPLFGISSTTSSFARDRYSFDLGVAIKGGLRIKFLKSMMLGVGVEYVYRGVSDFVLLRDTSNAIFSGEIGFVW
ncbi:MAG: hypothetical protein K2N67_06160 [Mucispirillum sp.]|nr:hypothetical protein [Mucispirillum sp.]